MRRTRSTLASVLAIAASLTLAACGGAADDADTAEPVETEEVAEPAVTLTQEEMETLVHDRHENYEEIGDAFKPIGETLKTGSPDMELILANAKVINEKLKLMPDAFPAGTGPEDGFDTDALQIIWAQKADFDEKMQAAIAASDDFVAAAEGGDVAAVKAAAGALGKSCKDCHDTYREDD